MRTKKTLGQNFLKSKSALYSIIMAGNLSSDDLVLEIGPGKGALTESLLDTKAKVISIEKDRELIPYLKEKFKSNIDAGSLILIEGDILENSIKDLFKKLKINRSDYKLIANIPYYITGEIIRKFLEKDLQPKLMVLLIQKEVAERIIAKDKKESVLSLSVKAYSRPKIITKVPRTAFNPVPNVDSAIISFESISKKLFIDKNISDRDFFVIIKTAFAHKRKRLGGNLKSIKDKLNQTEFEKIKDRRAEDLSIQDWINLIRKS